MEEENDGGDDSNEGHDVDHKVVKKVKDNGVKKGVCVGEVSTSLTPQRKIWHLDCSFLSVRGCFVV